jgi:hypothetical protein
MEPQVYNNSPWEGITMKLRKKVLSISIVAALSVAGTAAAQETTAAAQAAPSRHRWTASAARTPVSR